MSLVPFDDICHELDTFHSKFFDDTFWDHHHHFPSSWFLHHSWCCANFLRTKVSITDNGLRIKMDIPHFKRNEITVKTIDDVIVIEGKKKEQDDNRYCSSCKFIRKYKLPKGYHPNEVTSTLSSDGVLTVKAPAPVYVPKPKERIVNVKEIGPEY